MTPEATFRLGQAMVRQAVEDLAGVNGRTLAGETEEWLQSEDFDHWAGLFFQDLALSMLRQAFLTAALSRANDLLAERRAIKELARAA